MKFKILETFIASLWYLKDSQEGSHVKYKLTFKCLIIPKHKEISRWTLNNIFKIVSVHIDKDKKQIEEEFLKHYKKLK